MTPLRRLTAGGVLVVVVVLLLIGISRYASQEPSSTRLVDRPLVRSVKPQPHQSGAMGSGQSDPPALAADKTALEQTVEQFIPAYFVASSTPSAHQARYAAYVSKQFAKQAAAKHLTTTDAPSDPIHSARVVGIENGELGQGLAEVTVRMATVTVSGQKANWLVTLSLKRYGDAWLVNQLPTSPVPDYQSGDAT